MTVVFPNLLFNKVVSKRGAFISHFKNYYAPITTSQISKARVIVIKDIGQELFEANSPTTPLMKQPFNSCFIEFFPPINVKNFNIAYKDIEHFKTIEKIGGVYMQENEREVIEIWFNPSAELLTFGLRLPLTENQRCQRRSENQAIKIVRNKGFASLGENTLTFLNCKNVHLKPEGISTKRNRKRVVEGLPPMPPPYYVCRVDIPKSIYKKVAISGVARSFDYQFDVRGHFRTLKSERYVHKRYQMIWVPSFKKGTGEYIPKTYVFGRMEE